MPKTGSNIYKRKDGRWEGRYPKGRRADGAIAYGYLYARTCGEVKRRLASPPPTNGGQAPLSGRPDVTFAETAAQWLSAAALKVKPSTYAGYTASLGLHILPALGDCKMRRLTSADISCFAGEKLERGRADGNGGLAPKTVRDMLSVVKAVIDFARGENILSRGIAITYPKLPQRTTRVLSRREQSSLETVLNGGNADIHKLGILLCLYTGIRVGEVCALRWRDISVDFDTLSVRQTLQRVKNTGDGGKTKILIDAPKSPGSVRDIPIPKSLSPRLRELSRGDGYFLGTALSEFTEPRTMQNHFIRSVRAAGIAGANFHALRHTFATRCVEAGVDVKSLSEMLGHASVNITLNRYVHSSFEQKRKGMNKLERFIGI